MLIFLTAMFVSKLMTGSWDFKSQLPKPRTSNVIENYKGFLSFLVGLETIAELIIIIVNIV